MKYALVNNIKIEAQKGVLGICPQCGQPMIAKCGKLKIHHWAHKSKANCDSWWENETEWHREWKNCFPKEWQEIITINEATGEKHIADVRTNEGIVIEFQHSYITQEERILRESHYKKMVWVIDGERRKKTWEQYQKGLNNADIVQIDNKQIRIYKPDIYLPKEWLDSNVIVVIDFYCENDNGYIQHYLLGFNPKIHQEYRDAIIWEREEFVSNICNIKPIRPHIKVEPTRRIWSKRRRRLY